MKLPAPREFKGIGLLSHVCDHCAKPITFLTYRGRSGEYCSNECLETQENRKANTMATKKATTKAPKSIDLDTEVYEETEETIPVKKTKKVAKAAVEVPVKKTKKVAKVAAEPEPAPAKKAKKAGGKTTLSVGQLPEGMRAGTTKAALFLLLTDGDFHSMDECKEVAVAQGGSAVTGVAMPQHLIADGKKNGLWVAERNEEKQLRLVLQ